MKFTESKNLWYISVRVTCTSKWNIKETFMGNQGFVQIFLSFLGQLYLMKKKKEILATLSSLWESLGPILRNVGVIKFCSP